MIKLKIYFLPSAEIAEFVEAGFPLDVRPSPAGQRWKDESGHVPVLRPAAG